MIMLECVGAFTSVVGLVALLAGSVWLVQDYIKMRRYVKELRDAHEQEFVNGRWQCMHEQIEER